MFPLVVFLAVQPFPLTDIGVKLEPRNTAPELAAPAPVLLGLPAPFVAVSRRFPIIVLIDPVEVKEQLTSYPS